jgi:hypothetical protein
MQDSQTGTWCKPMQLREVAPLDIKEQRAYISKI